MKGECDNVVNHKCHNISKMRCDNVKRMSPLGSFSGLILFKFYGLGFGTMLLTTSVTMLSKLFMTLLLK